MSWLLEKVEIIGTVELSGLNFVRDKSILVAASRV